MPGGGRRPRRARGAGAALVVAAALVVFAVQALGWPTAPGRDLESYVAVYADFWSTDAVFPWEMLSRTPVAPLVVGGILDLGSPLVVEAFAALLFAGSVLLHTRTALLFGPGPAVLVAARAPALPRLRRALPRARERDRLRRRVRGLDGARRARRAHADGVAVRRARRGDRAHRAHATREPGVPRRRDPAPRARGQLAGARSGGRSRSSASPSSCSEPGRRRTSGATTTSQSPAAARRASRSSARSPSTGSSRPTTARRRGSWPPSSSASSCPKEPYRSYGVDLETFFARGSPRLHEDLIVLSDRHYGWDSDYELLGRVARESVRAHPGTFARNVLGELWEELSQPLFAGRVDEPAAVTAAPGARRWPRPRPALPGADRGRGRPVRAPERAALDARREHPRGLDVADRARPRVRRPREASAVARERPARGRALRRLPRSLVEPVARPPDGSLVEALPAALVVAPRRCRRASRSGARGAGGRPSRRPPARS